MCSRVGADYDSINFKENNWYYKHSWTRDEEIEFEEWLRDTKDKDIIKDLGLNAKTRREKQVRWFVTCYGWKLEGEPELFNK